MADGKEFTVEGARIIFRNFSGEEGQYNRAGDRNFAVVLDPEVAGAMEQDGWNVKTLKPRNEEEEETPVPYIQVAVSYKNRPPKIVQLTNGGQTRTHINEELVDTLDWAEIQNVDLIARGYDWNVNGLTGTKAYLKTMFITIEEDALERKYASMDAGAEDPF